MSAVSTLLEVAEAFEATRDLLASGRLALVGTHMSIEERRDLLEDIAGELHLDVSEVKAVGK